ncbi:MAG: ATP-binding cassette domain-containing protein [Acidimicrobiia bacterium]
MDPVIRTEELSKVFQSRGHEVRAVDGLNLEVQRGEIYGLLGPNGAGKTTTVGMLTTRVIPTAGQALVNGIDVVADPTAAKQLIGVVPQVNTLDRSLNVSENLYFHARYFGMSARASRARTEELLERFKLVDKAKDDTLALSGGMAQRLMVARALMHNPQVLFLDEPTSGLDPQSRLALWEVIDELHAAGQTVLLTTHYMEEADQLCDRLAIVDHGKLLALGTPAELKGSVGADTTIRVKATGGLEDASTRAKAVAGVERAEVADGCINVFLQGESGGVLAQVIAAIDDSSTTINDVEISEPTLETVFINLTGKELRD